MFVLYKLYIFFPTLNFKCAPPYFLTESAVCTEGAGEKKLHALPTNNQPLLLMLPLEAFITTSHSGADPFFFKLHQSQ